MNKTLFLPFLLLLAIPSFADRNIFIEGSAVEITHRMYFMENFSMEAVALGYTVVNNRQEAGYTFRFDVQRNDGQYYYDEEYEYEPEPEFNLKITLMNNATNTEMLSFNWPYSSLDEMYEYNQFLLVRATTSIPEEEGGKADRSWQRRVLYIRFSIDYPVSFYALQGDGLHAGMAAYNIDFSGKFINPNPLDNKVIARPGVTVGLEWQIVKFLAVEANVQTCWGAPEDDNFFGAGLNAQIKVPIAFAGVVLQPYGLFAYPFFVSQTYTLYYPPFSVGGGIQAGIRAGKRGSFFIDASYALNLKKIAIKNPYGEFSPNPPNIFYRRSVLGLSAGYKIGFIERKR